jgi:hypothetical protein
LEVIKHLREVERWNRFGGWENEDLHAAPWQHTFLHTQFFVREVLVKHEMSVISQLPYFPDLAPANFLLFLRLKSTLIGLPISDSRRDRRIFATGPMRYPARCVPGHIPELEKTLEAVCKQWKGIL